LGGFAHIFAAVPADKLLLKAPAASSLNGYSIYATLALGSALSLFLYPHAMTALLSASSANTVRRNMALLPAYTLVLGLLALLGFMALAAGVGNMPQYAGYFKQYGANFVVPALFLHFFPSWFVGIAFAAIGIGALVPAAIMSIAAANLYTRNIHKAFVNPQLDSASETRVAKNVSLIVKLGALAFILCLPTTYAVQLQLLGGIWIIQTLPAIVLGLYLRFLDARALLLGWAAGMGCGTWMVLSLQLKSSIFTLHIAGLGIPGYAAVWSLLLNLAISIALSLFFAAGRKYQYDNRNLAMEYLNRSQH
jgi:SSS family solute:Na+ symporter